MIIFFSATGNCKYVAKRISDALGQKDVSVTDCIQRNIYEFTDDITVIISPTYFWGLPSIVADFLKSQSSERNISAYCNIRDNSGCVRTYCRQTYKGQKY